MHSRIGLHDLPFRTSGQEQSAREDWHHYVVEALGPAVSVLQQGYEGYRDIQDGHTRRGAEKIAPKFVRDISKAFRYAEEGAKTKSGDLVAGGFSKGQIAAQAGGIAPAAVSEGHENRNAIKDNTRHINKRKRELEARFVEAKETGASDLAELRRQVRDWNRHHRDHKINMNKAAEKVRKRKSLKDKLKKLRRNNLLNPRVRDERVKALEAELEGLQSQ